MPSLLERQAELQMLGTAVERAAAGRGSAVLVLGEAGIGKTSLVHAFLAAVAGRARILAGACEDLLTPRALGLGARPAAAIVRRRLRDLGATRLPRRPQPGTLANPAGLTGRQLEILRLVAAGLSNAEIAQRLVVSPRTVDHHVSAILAKLGVPTRREAATWAARLEDQPPGA